MSSLLTEGNVRVLIRRVTIHSNSSIAARRLADGVLPALERELARAALPDARQLGRRSSADHAGTTTAARAIAAAIAARL
jgi:hypothetical protein